MVVRVKMTASPLSHSRFPETLHTMEENTIVGAILCCTFQALVGWTLSLILEKAFTFRPWLNLNKCNYKALIGICSRFSNVWKQPEVEKNACQNWKYIAGSKIWVIRSYWEKDLYQDNIRIDIKSSENRAALFSMYQIWGAQWSFCLFLVPF